MLGVLRMAPWRRGPLLLLRRPGVLTALVAASFVAALPAAAAAPFISSARNETLDHRINDSCAYRVGPVIDTTAYVPTAEDVSQGQTPVGVPYFDKVQSDLTNALGPGNGFAPADSTLITQTLATETADPTPDTPARIVLLSRPGAEQHVTVLDGPVGEGVWVPDGWAAETHTKIGSTIVIPYTDQGVAEVVRGTTRVRVSAIYRDLRSSPDQPYWCGLVTIYRGPPGAEFSNVSIPPVLITDEKTLVQAITGKPGYDGKYVLMRTSFPLSDPHLTYEKATSLLPRIARLTNSIKPDPNGIDDQETTSELGTFVTRARFTGSATVPGIAPITLAGVLVGLLMVAAAAVFWVLRRRRELTILSARGVGATALGVKAVIEALPALVIGAGGGWVAAIALVRSAGPNPLISGNATKTAALLTAASFLASVLVVLVTAGLRCRSLADERPPRHALHALHWPWELALLAGAPFAWRYMSGATTIADPTGAGEVVHVPARLLVVPLMVIIGAAAFVGRLGIVWLRRRTRKAAPRSSALYIGLQRIAREAAIVVLLAGATAAPIALAAYGGTVTRSVKASVDAEAELHVGSNVVVDVPKGTPIPASLAKQGTLVHRVNGLVIGGVQTDLLAVDPATFAQGAYWDAQINGQTMAQMIAPLQNVSATSPYPALAINSVPGGPQQVAYPGTAPTTYDVTDVPTLPAAQGGYPVIIVPLSTFPLDNPGVQYQMWFRGDPTEIRAKLAAAKTPLTYIDSSDDLFVDTLYDPLTFTFDYLTWLSLLGGLVTMVGLLLYLEARTPRHRRAYVMFRRMGLRPRTHRGALLIEIGIPLIAGLIGGLILAAGLAKALSGNFDVDVSIPPGTILSIPVLAVILIGFAVLALAGLAATYAQLRIGRANPSEVLRDTV